MVPVLLSLAASSCWGVADFLGGLQSKRVPVADRAAAWWRGPASSASSSIIAATGEPLPGTRAALLAMVAGVAGVIALGCFYRALSIGTMSIVAPISATGVALPVVVGIATGDRLSTIVAAGLAVTVVGRRARLARAATTTPSGPRPARLSVGLALVAAVGFGSYFVLSDAAADDSVLWLLVLSRIIPVPALAALRVARAGCARRPRAARSILVAAGTLDCGATALYGVANTKGALSIVSVVGSLYPVMTLILARAVLGERIRPRAAGRASRRRWPASR